jgi:membrane protein DedA with SNARE-associated domain
MEGAGGHIAQLILEYRYWILVPLCFIEGPIVAFVAGALASVGYFNVYLLALIFFIRDIALDAFMYGVGHFGSETRFAHWILKKIKVTEAHLRSVHNLWEKNPGKTMFFSKLSYGLSATFLIVAGFVGMSFKKFITYGAMVTVMQYGVLLVLGYYFGGAFGTISSILNNLGFVILGISIFITGYYVFTHIMRNRLLAKEKAEENQDESASV